MTAALTIRIGPHPGVSAGDRPGRLRHDKAVLPIPQALPEIFLVLFLAVVFPCDEWRQRAWLSYRDQRDELGQLLGVEARSAGSRFRVS